MRNLIETKSIIRVAFIAGIVAITALNFSLDQTHLTDGNLTEAQQEVIGNPAGGYPTFNYSYSPEKENLEIELTGNPFIAETGGLILGNRSYRPAFLLNTSEREKKTNIWARTKLANLLHAETDVSLMNALRNFGHNGVADFPVRTGAELLIKKDFTDKDGDGRKGIENNETITLFTEQPGGEVEKFAYISVTNNTVRTYRLDPYSDQRWKPCNKPREGCTIPSLYKFREQP